ncbi:MAG: esterase/lipase family protein, partial [Longimicrobiaceae bacterium]
MRDKEINRGDTYFAVEVATRRSAMLPERVSASGGEIGTSAINPVQTSFEQSYIESGYSTDGDLRFSVYPEPTADTRAGTPPSLIRAVGDQVTVYDQSGRVILSRTFRSFMEGAGLPGGTLNQAAMDGGFYMSDPDSDISAMGAEAEIERIGSDRLKITMHIAPSHAAGTGVSPMKATDAGVTIVRSYRSLGSGFNHTSEQAAGERSVWRLERLEQSSRRWTPEGEALVHLEAEFTYRHWRVNPAEDRKRHEAREETLRSMALEPPPPGEEPPPPPPPPPPPDDDTGFEVCGRSDGQEYIQGTVSDGPPVVYQHGICSGADTWDGMRPSLGGVFAFGLRQAYNLDTNSRLEVQTTDLIERLERRVGGNIVIGHSQGGLIARRLGQRRSDLVNGVITIGTPHRGARIATRTREYVADGIRSVLSGYCYGDFFCNIFVSVLADVTAKESVYGLLPVVEDNEPGSAFLATLNGTYEGFRRASIENDANPRWSLFRLAGDLTGERTDLLYDNPPNGRNWVVTTEYTYWSGWFLQFLALVVLWQADAYGYGWGCHKRWYSAYWAPCSDPYGYGDYWYSRHYWGRVANLLYTIGSAITGTLDSVDRFWVDAVAGGYYPMDG